MTITHRAFVKALYRGVLERDPDSVGLGAHLGRLNGTTDSDELGALVRAFLTSGEYRARHGGAAGLDSIRSAGAETLFQQPAGAAPFAHAASLGSHCYPSWMLKQAGLKRYSLPFDWIFSNLAMVRHCIEDDFGEFLNRAHYQTKPLELRPSPEEQVAGHKFYEAEFGVEAIFNHYDPGEPERYAYLTRSVERFRRLLDCGARVLFVALVMRSSRSEPGEQFRATASLLDRRCRGRAALLMVDVHGGSGDPDRFGCSVAEEAGPHRLLELQPTSHMIGLNFSEPFDDLLLRRMLAGYRFALADSV